MRELVEQIDESIVSWKGLRVGDMCTSYYKGYYKVLGFAPYNNGSNSGPLQCIHQRVADSFGQPCGGRPRSCAADYCKKVTINKLNDDEEFERESLRLRYCALRGICKELENAKLASSQT